MSDTTSKKPSHRAFVVTGEPDNRYWTEIGAQWAHDDGQGFTLRLNALPVSGEIVLRVPKAKDQAS